MRKIFENELKELIDKMDFSNGKYNRRQIFQDVVTLETYFINIFLLNKKEFEKEYDVVMGKYDVGEREKVFKLMLNLAELFQKQTEPKDILGNIYNRLEISNKNTGQFFTPTHISDLMAEITGIDEQEIKENGYVTLCEPCVGAGGMVLSYAKILKEKGYNPKSELFVEACDIDILCTFMTYVQLSMYDIPAIVINGNTLTLQENIVLYTPQYYRGFWNFKKIFK